MAEGDKTVQITWQVNIQQLQKALKAQAAYRKEMQAVTDQTKLMITANQYLERTYQQQAQTVSQTVSQMGAYTEAVQQQAQVNTETTDALFQQIQAQKQNAQAQTETVAATEQATEATKKQEQAVAGSSTAWLKHIKTLALYTIGAASVFRIVMKIRRVFTDTVETLFKNTEEYKRLQDAQDKLKISFVAIAGGSEEWRRILDALAKTIDTIATGITRAAATVNGLVAVMRAATQDTEAFGQTLMAFGSLARADVTGFLSQIGKAAEDNVGLATAYLDAYNATIQDASELTTQFARSGEKISSAKDELGRLSDEQKKYNDLLEKLIQAEQSRIDALLDLFKEYERGLQDIALETQRAFEDLALKGAREREDIEIDYQRRLENIREQARNQQARNEEKLRLKLLRIELRFREKMLRIQEDFEDSIYDAISKRDATQALLAIRRKSRDEARARRERDDAITLARAENQALINEQQRSLEEQRRAAELARRRALEDLRRDMERERQDILLNRQRELQDLDQFLQQRQDDIEADYERQTQRALDFYAGDEAHYKAYLERKLRDLQNYYAQVARIHNVNMGLLALPDMSATGTSGAGGGGVKRAAQGMDETFTSPTMIQVAEAGRHERVVAQPITPGVNNIFSGTMRHQITGSIDAAMAGFEGRMGAIITEKVISVMGEMLQ